MRPQLSTLITRWKITFLCILMTLFALSSKAQSSGDLHHLHTLQIASMGNGTGSKELRQRIIERLSKSSRLRVVDDASSADAILRGASNIWTTGTVSLEPHSRSTSQTNYQGYLSVELVDKNNQTLWSYLITPSRFHLGSITDDLADHMAQHLLEAVADGAASSAGSTTVTGSPRVALHVAGATFPAPLYRKWIESSGMTVTYDAIGSDAGMDQLAQGKVDLAAADTPSTPENLHVRYFPTVLGGVVPIYNLPGAGRDLHLTPEVLAGIYSGAIHKWNDPRIREANRSIRLPDAEIAVVHRSDGSGTTFVWTSYLSQVSPQWKSSVGADTHVAWPTGVGAEGNDGVAATVKKTPNSIGYVELIYAIQHELNYAEVRNPAGQFVKATLSSITAAAAGTNTSSTQDFRFSILNSPNREAYPISTFTWLLVPEEGLDKQKKTAIASLLNWMLTSGQKDCAALGYAPLPHEIIARELKALDTLK